MQRLSLLIVAFLTLLSVSTVFAKKYQIKALNTPTITINGIKMKVGDRFDDSASISWEKDKQAMRVLSEDNKVYTISAKLYKDSKSTKFSDFIDHSKQLMSSTTPMASRKINISLLRQLRKAFSEYFLMLDCCEINLADTDLLPDAVIFIEPSDSRNTKIEPLIVDKLLIINRDDLVDMFTDYETKCFNVYLKLPGSYREFHITDSLKIELLPNSID